MNSKLGTSPRMRVVDVFENIRRKSTCDAPDSNFETLCLIENLTEAIDLIFEPTEYGDLIQIYRVCKLENLPNQRGIKT